MNRNIISDLNHIFSSCISAVLPEHLIRKTIKFNSLSKQLSIADKIYDIRNKNIYVVGTGKAVQNMAYEIDKILSSNIKQGIISIPKGSSKYNFQNPYMCYYEGAKDNLPDTDAYNTAIKIKNLASKLTENDILLVLISGGGSALLPLPKTPITLEEKCSIIKKLANSGADIKELNVVRKRISDLKGGQLATHAHPALVVSLILSDIVGDPLDLIASGPTCKNCDASSAALNIINRYNLYNELPKSIKIVLESNNIECTFKNNVDNVIMGSNKLSIEAAMIEAKNKAYIPINISNTIVGNIKQVTNEYAKLVKIVIDLKNQAIEDNVFDEQIKSLNIPGFKSFQPDSRNAIKTEDLCFILGGEITVEVKGDGKGGRNQQLPLEFSKAISGFKNMSSYEIYFLSAGTDGIDGPTNAAGAIGYKNLIKDSETAKIDVNHYLENNDSYNFYKKFMNGDLHIITGHTNTNVMDIHLIIIKKVNDN